MAIGSSTAETLGDGVPQSSAKAASVAHASKARFWKDVGGDMPGGGIEIPELEGAVCDVLTRFITVSLAVVARVLLVLPSRVRRAASVKSATLPGP